MEDNNETPLGVASDSCQRAGTMSGQQVENLLKIISITSSLGESYQPSSSEAISFNKIIK